MTHAQTSSIFPTMLETASNATVKQEKSAKPMDLARAAQHMNSSNFRESMPERNVSDQNAPMVSFKEMDHAQRVTNVKPSIQQRLHVCNQLVTQDQPSNTVESVSNAQLTKPQLS